MAVVRWNTVAVYSWSIAKNFVIDFYCRFAKRRYAKLHRVAQKITLDLTVYCNLELNL